MAAGRKILALGVSTAGGDWPPLAAVVLGLSQRGHSVRCFADAPIATALRDTAVAVDAVRPHVSLRSYVTRWNERIAAEPSVAKVIRAGPREVQSGWVSIPRRRAALSNRSS